MSYLSQAVAISRGTRCWRHRLGPRRPLAEWAAELCEQQVPEPEPILPSREDWRPGLVSELRDPAKAALANRDVVMCWRRFRIAAEQSTSGSAAS